MKFCLKSNQDHRYLVDAEEIKIDYKDFKALPEYFERYNNKIFIVQIYMRYGEDIDWDKLVEYKTLAQGKDGDANNEIVLCLGDINNIQKAKELGFRYYYGFPVNNFYDLRALKELGVCYFRLEAPVFFEMDRVKKLGVPVRAVANVAYLSDIPKTETWCAPWIRPEDMPIYEDYIDVIEFESCPKERERALYRIYAQEHNWPGDLDMIITNLQEAKVCNRLIYPEDMKARLNCGQRCQSGGGCRLCMREFMLANEERVRNYFAAIKEKEEDSPNGKGTSNEESSK